MIDAGRGIAKPPMDLSDIVDNDEALSFVGISGHHRSVVAVQSLDFRGAGSPRDATTSAYIRLKPLVEAPVAMFTPSQSSSGECRLMRFRFR